MDRWQVEYGISNLCKKFEFYSDESEGGHWNRKFFRLKQEVENPVLYIMRQPKQNHSNIYDFSENLELWKQEIEEYLSSRKILMVKKAGKTKKQQKRIREMLRLYKVKSIILNDEILQNFEYSVITVIQQAINMNITIEFDLVFFCLVFFVFFCCNVLSS